MRWSSLKIELNDYISWLLLDRGKTLDEDVKAKFDVGREGARIFSSLTDFGDILSKNIPRFIPRSFVDLFSECTTAVFPDLS